MKRSLIVIFLLFFVGVNGQDSLNKTNIGLDFSMGNNAIGRSNIYPSITLSNNKHVAFAGSSFIYGMEYNPSPPAYGFFGGYQFFPNGKKNRFNLFFEYDLNWVKKQFKFSESPINYTPSLVKRSAVISSLDNYLGFGFHINLSRAFYFHTNVGLGIIWYKESVSDEYNNGLISNYGMNDVYVGKFSPYVLNHFGSDDVIGFRGGTHLIGIFKAGIGMNIYSFKKKNKEQK